MAKIAFLAISEAHQIFHWLPGALRLARTYPVEVSVLSPSRHMLEFISSFDPEQSLILRTLRQPPFSPDSLFRLPSRLAVLLMNYDRLLTFPYIATTEVSSAHLRRVPGFSARMIHLKHGAGDREGGYNPRHAAYDLTLVMGEKDRERLIARGLATPDNCKVTGYSKFELMGSPQRFFPNDNPVILYNPHFDPALSPWHDHAEEILRHLESLRSFNFIIAPHVKSRAGRFLSSSAETIRIDRGSRYSIDMTYANSADIYLGDISSQVYEFIRQPRPCVFTNFTNIDWHRREQFAHWHMGQVVDRLADLETALARARMRQPEFAKLQKERFALSASIGDRPASERQAEAIARFMSINRE
ncbi:hypothetical protein [Sphingobium bisphenolivorans]|uniref:hypothetical protein n=1 Tax=Sphingobium bisphenolivorans TaxID=1335760 RepID=UPI0003B7A6F8|nr:hypothetical protein [Sphingobium bisphenolivorans]